MASRGRWKVVVESVSQGQLRRKAKKGGYFGFKH